MPIDPSILNNLQPVKFEDPMTRYANFLALQGAMNKNDEYENTLAQTGAFNAAMKKALRPDGTYDRGVVRAEVINSGHGALLPDQEKKWVDLDKGLADKKHTEAQAGKVRAETVAKKMEFFNNQWGGIQTLQDALALNDAMFADPDTGAFFAGFGDSREKGAAALNAAAKNGTLSSFLANKQRQALGLEKALKTRVDKVDRGDKIDLVQTNEYGPASPQTVGSYKVGLSPNKPEGTKVVVSTGGKIEEAGGKAFSEEQGKYLSEQLKTARMAPQMARDADRALSLINGGVFSGKAANLQTEAARVMKAMGIPVGPEITNTEQLAALLADKVLNAIHTSGLGARGMDTPAERVYVEKAKLGDKTLDKETLVTGARLLKKAAEFAVQNYNDTARTAPESWFQGSGAPRSLPGLAAPKKPGAPASGGGLKPGAVVNGYRFKGGDPNKDTNWEKVR